MQGPKPAAWWFSFGPAFCAAVCTFWSRGSVAGLRPGDRQAHATCGDWKLLRALVDGERFLKRFQAGSVTLTWVRLEKGPLPPIDMEPDGFGGNQKAKRPILSSTGSLKTKTGRFYLVSRYRKH